MATGANSAGASHAFQKHAPLNAANSCSPQSACLQVSTGKHCVQWLADYIIEAATPAADQSWAKAEAGHPELTAAAMLRQGAYALYGACSPTGGEACLKRSEGLGVMDFQWVLLMLSCCPVLALKPPQQAPLPVVQVQHLHAALGSGAGGMHRAALADLRKDFERSFKYTGKA